MPRNTAVLSARYQLLISEDVTSPETSMKREISGNRPWRVIIVGGGFGGLRAAQTLKSDLFDVTLIDRRNYHLLSAPSWSSCGRLTVARTDFSPTAKHA